MGISWRKGTQLHLAENEQNATVREKMSAAPQHEVCESCTRPHRGRSATCEEKRIPHG
jgi:hypothetical protein